MVVRDGELRTADLETVTAELARVSSAAGGVRLMAYELASDAYGKAQNRLMRVVRDGPVHEIRDVTVDVRLRGDFEAVYLEGDNTGIPATDTMKNTVFALGKTDVLDRQHRGIRQGARPSFRASKRPRR